MSFAVCGKGPTSEFKKARRAGAWGRGRTPPRPWIPAGDRPARSSVALASPPNRVRCCCATYHPGAQLTCDLAVLPLALRGTRAHAYATPPSPLVLVHDWLWRPRGHGAVVAWWLGKRINLVRAVPLDVAAPAAIAS